MGSDRFTLVTNPRSCCAVCPTVGDNQNHMRHNEEDVSHMSQKCQTRAACTLKDHSEPMELHVCDRPSPKRPKGTRQLEQRNMLRAGARMYFVLKRGCSICGGSNFRRGRQR